MLDLDKDALKHWCEMIGAMGAAADAAEHATGIGGPLIPYALCDAAERARRDEKAVEYAAVRQDERDRSEGARDEELVLTRGEHDVMGRALLRSVHVIDDGDAGSAGVDAGFSAMPAAALRDTDNGFVWPIKDD